MSGVFGVLDPAAGAGVGSLAAQMARALSYCDWFVAEHGQDEAHGVALGRMGIGVFNREPQPVWNASRSVTLTLAGEIYNAPALIRQHALASDTRPEHLAMSLYEKLGERFASQLEGAFVIALWDQARRRLVLANDRFGVYPTYLAQPGGRFVFAPEVKGVLAVPGIDRTLRPEAVVEYVRFQHLLGHKTFFAGVQLLPAATVLVYSAESATYALHRYWDFSQIAPLPASLTFDEAVEEGSRLFRRAVEKRVHAAERVGVFLSGGLDGRGLLGLIPPDQGPVHTFTFGQRGCRDEHYARQIAAAAGAHHHYYPFEDGRWILDHMDLHLQTTEGFHPWIHMHGITLLGDARQYVDVNLSGLGDLLWTQPNFTPRQLVLAPDDIAFNAIFYDLYTQKYTWPGLTEAEASALFHASFAPRAPGLALESFLQELAPYRHLPYPQRAAAFNLVNHFLRYIGYAGVFGRSHIEFRYPYLDHDLLAFCSALPHELGDDRRLQKAILVREVPALARVPTTDDELPLTLAPRLRQASRLMTKLKSGFHQFVAPVFPPRATLYADYETWLRTDLRAWAEGVLLDERTLARGFFRPEAVRSLLDRHMAGHQLWTIGKFAHLITFELMLRRWHDQ
jgi:asparagine synthase (glutamine-hydrolysing)